MNSVRKLTSERLVWPLRLLALMVLAIPGTLTAYTQDITPVDVDAKKPEQPRLHYYDRHGNKLSEPVYFLAETDTVKKSGPASPWPLFNGVTVGVNFFDAAMLIAGQSFASFDLNAAVSLLNWVFPTVECGLGFSKNHQEGTSMVYRTHLSPYVKVGFDYNFLYKSSPDYMAGLGIRVGWSNPRYEVIDAEITSSYWDQTSGFSIYDQSVNAWFGEALAAVRVKIWKGLSLGWSIRYRFKLRIPDASASTPWFIPGYGGGSPLTATFSLSYTFGRKSEVDIKAGM